MKKLIKLGIPLKANDGLGYPLNVFKDRFRHLYCLGKTQTGKSTFFLNLIKQDLDHAIIVLDPAGTFAQSVASLAPSDRLIYIDKDNPITINLLRRNATRSEISNQFIEVVNNCVSGTTPSIEMTVLMGEIVRNAIRVLPDKHLEIDYLSDFLNYDHIRNEYRDDNYWRHFDDTDKKGWYIHREKRESAQRVGARLSAFILDENLKKFVLGQNQFIISDIVKNKKILCFNLKGFDNDLMLYIGNLITTNVKYYYQHEASTESEPLFLYCDEWQNFLSPAFNNMLAECAKFKISVNLSHQTFGQTNPKTLNIVLGNAYTKIIFNCGYEEAERLAKEMNTKPQEFINLKKYEALVQIGNELHKILTFPPPIIKPFQPEKNIKREKQQATYLRDSWIMV